MSVTSTTLLLDSSQTTNDSAHFSVNYIPPIQLNSDLQYEIGLISCTAWHSMANVKTGVNDYFTFPSVAPAWISFRIPQGAYKVTDLKKTMKELMTTTSNAVVADSFELIPNYNTLRARITVKKSFVNRFFIINKY